MKLSYKQKLFTYFLFLFAVFTLIIVVFQKNREKNYKVETLKTSLLDYSDIIANFVRDHNIHDQQNVDTIQYILKLLPDNLRVTIVERDGKVLFDNDADKSSGELENHLMRPEIQSALIQNTGTTTRLSRTIGKEYYYVAKYYDPFFIRVALPYDIEIQNFLKPDNAFLYFIMLLFFITIISLFYISDKFGKVISGLKDFLVSAEKSTHDYSSIKLPHSDFGEIGEKIIQNYRQIEESNNQINIEREKLIRHFHHSEEGIAIFSSTKEKIYANTHFIQYLNTILDEPTFKVEGLMNQPEFKKVFTFHENNTPVNPNLGNIPVFQDKINKGGKHYSVKLLIFPDNSFEITLNNISESEKTRLLKQEMTNNIAHELKTPVSSIRGYIETLLSTSGIPADKQRFFLKRTYSQVMRLSDLIRDIALITKTEEASELFEKEDVDVKQTFQEVINDLEDKIATLNVKIINNLEESIIIKGNKTLVYAIFRNLIENSMSYAGEDITISINKYTEDPEFYYFSYYDNGKGIEEKHLDKIFDRFYRVSEGRTRDTGGSGLGLSIVKNAVIYHKGEILAKNRKDGGLEFLFSLKKN